ncbi:MAG: DUF2808 domain-containing protein [Leptolyngbyaceae cyanobacterium SM2_5_2]|nr:DUF2808 domain-containing protein [Leptolyngbyaceae cyanobacterium SM2_5_2]
MKSLKRAAQLTALGLIAATVAAVLGTAMLTPPSQAQTGLTIFGGIEPEFRLGYVIDFNAPRSNNARYYLQVNRNKLPREVISLQIDYPETFIERQGQLDSSAIELRRGDWRGNEVIPVKAIDWIEEEGRIEIIPEQPIPANTNFVVVFSNVRNPNRYGYHYFNLRMMYQGDVIDQYVGTWPLELGAGDN